MSLKSRLQKSRETKTFSFTDTDCDLLAYFEAHAELDAVTVYAHDRIFGEKNGVQQKISLSFPTKENYLAEIRKITSLHDVLLNETNPHVVINTQTGAQINICVSPMVTSEPFVSLSRRCGQRNILQNKLISSEIAVYLSECLDKNANIFIAGNASVDKIAVMKTIAGLQGENKKLIICENGASMKLNKPCVATFSKDLLKDFIGFNYDNIFCPETNVDDLVNIFRLIISGCYGFVVSLSVKSGAEILSAVRNMILLSNINLFEENADFLATSSMDVVVSVDLTENNEVRITKVSEMSKNMKNEIVLKDIFVWNKLENLHISTGNQSKFYNFENSKKFNPEFLEEGYMHDYAEDILKEDDDIFEITPVSTNNFEISLAQNEITIENTDENEQSDIEVSVPPEPAEEPIEDVQEPTVEEPVPEKKSKLQKLKEKLKRDKELANKSETAEVLSDVRTDTETPETVEVPEVPETPSVEDDVLAELAQDAEDFQQLNKFETPKEFDLSQNEDDGLKQTQEPTEEDVTVDNEVETAEIVDENDNDTSNEGLFASESDDFSDEPVYSQPKIRNILEDYDDEDEQEPSSEVIDAQFVEEEQPPADGHADLNAELTQEEIKEEEDILSKYENAEEEPKAPIDPELFAEIKNVDVDDYSDADLTDIPDSDI